MGDKVIWEDREESAVAVLGHLGKLLVRRKVADFEVVVLGIQLKARSPDIGDGKTRAVAAATAWVTQAARKLEILP